MLISLLFALIGSYGQSPLTFDSNDFDFGDIQEEAGAVTHTFNFKNISTDTIRITAVKASCGCTTPGWTKEPVAPGGEGFITAKYNPYNRPGNFKKSLNVSTKGVEVAKTTLLIQGNVVPRPKTIKDLLPTKLGAMRVRYRSLNMGKITNEEIKIQEFDTYNDSETSWSFLPAQTIAEDFIKIDFAPLELAPGSKGKIIVRYDPALKNDLGFQSDQIRIFTTEDVDQQKNMNVIATIEDYFPPMTAEELAIAPKLAFDKTIFDFGKVSADARLVTSFELTNSGKEPLEIRKVKTNCACTTAQPNTDVIEPGESTALEVTFDTNNRKGRQYKSITVFSNDPSAPTQVISIRAELPKS